VVIRIARRKHNIAALTASVLAAGTILSSGFHGAPDVRAGSGYSNQQGVDACTLPTASQLSSLWLGTPFYWWAYYLGGATAQARGCAPFSSSLLTTARNIGWGFAPIWDDLQSPSGCGGSYSHRMSINTTTAYSQGQTSALKALAAMQSAGFASYDQVWLDIEAYSYGTTGCKAAVNSYVNGWDSLLGGDSGVYGSSVGSQVDSWWTISHPPIMVWMGSWDHPTANPNTVWSISGVSNSHWNRDLRMHQYRGMRTYSNLVVDVDCAVAWIDGGSATTVIPSDTAQPEPDETTSITAEPVCAGTTQP
jgi:hypothetical protein